MVSNSGYSHRRRFCKRLKGKYRRPGENWLTNTRASFYALSCISQFLPFKSVFVRQRSVFAMQSSIFVRKSQFIPSKPRILFNYRSKMLCSGYFCSSRRFSFHICDGEPIETPPKVKQLTPQQSYGALNCEPVAKFNCCN